MAPPCWLPVRGRLAAGRVSGLLRAGEDRAALEAALVDVERRVLTQACPLLVHAPAQGREEELEATRARKRAALMDGRLKRYVVPLETAAGPRILKVAECTSVGNLLRGVIDSVARREHQNQRRVEALELAVSETLGFLELRRGPVLRRAIQVQTPMREDLPALDHFLRQGAAQRGEGAWADLGTALAATHRVPFFHADLKGFHAFVERAGSGPAVAPPYRLRWLDLARVSFRVGARQRVINLYQALRFLVPREEHAQAALVTAYCRAAGWHADAPERALRRVQRFLAHKLRTHPVVE